MIDPREISPGSNMPPYAAPGRRARSTSRAAATSCARCARSACPTSPSRSQRAAADARGAGRARSRSRARAGRRARVAADSELVALISYLQRLGKRRAPPAGDAEARRQHAASREVRDAELHGHGVLSSRARCSPIRCSRWPLHGRVLRRRRCARRRATSAATPGRASAARGARAGEPEEAQP